MGFFMCVYRCVFRCVGVRVSSSVGVCVCRCVYVCFSHASFLEWCFGLDAIVFTSLCCCKHVLMHLCASLDVMVCWVIEHRKTMSLLHRSFAELGRIVVSGKGRK